MLYGVMAGMFGARTFARVNNGKVSPVLTKAREVLVKDGFQGLRDAVKAGVLPIAVLGLLGLSDDKTPPPGQPQS